MSVRDWKLCAWCANRLPLHVLTCLYCRKVTR